MDYYESLYRTIRDLQDESLVNTRLVSKTAMTLQGDLIWHGFASALNVYFPYQLCCRLGSYPSVTIACLEYLEFCGAHMRLATRAQVHSMFGEFVHWKEKGLHTRLEARPLSTRQWFEFTTLKSTDRESYDGSSRWLNEFHAASRELHRDVEQDLFKVNEAVLIATTGSNLERTLLDMKTSVYQQLAQVNDPLIERTLF
jgi:hypothetical protein